MLDTGNDKLNEALAHLDQYYKGKSELPPRVRPVLHAYRNDGASQPAGASGSQRGDERLDALEKRLGTVEGVAAANGVAIGADRERIETNAADNARTAAQVQECMASLVDTASRVEGLMKRVGDLELDSHDNEKRLAVIERDVDPPESDDTGRVTERVLVSLTAKLYEITARLEDALAAAPPPPSAEFRRLAQADRRYTRRNYARFLEWLELERERGR